MIAELEQVWRRWQETDDALRDCLTGIPSDRYGWQPLPGGTTVGWIVQHIVRADCGYALRVLGEDPGTRPSPEVPDGVAATGALDLSAEYVRRAFEHSTPDTLRRPLVGEWYPLGPRVEGPLDALWFLEQMIRHKAYHLGQLWYLRMLIEG